MKTALVVGGAGGLGAAVVRELLDRGLAVVVAGRGRARDERVRQSRIVDATHADWRELYARAAEDLQAPLDAVLFVAGSAVFGKTALVPPERAREVFELNFWACGAAATAAGEHWSERRRPGAFLAVLSIVARRAVPFEAHYAASKAACARFLECLELEYGPKGIRFVAAYPGMLRTPFRRGAAWYGLAPPGADQGADAGRTARRVVDLLQGRRKTRVIGWRERSIDLADRLVPGLYDRTVLRRRVKHRLG